MFRQGLLKESPLFRPLALLFFQNDLFYNLHFQFRFFILAFFKQSMGIEKVRKHFEMSLMTGVSRNRSEHCSARLERRN